MKTLFTIILLTIALSVFGQREYTHENKGVNVFLEADGSANLDFALGGPALTIGYQFNPHFFFGCGLSNKYGGTRSARPEDTKPLGWYDANDDTFHDDYFIDEKGERHKIIDKPYDSELEAKITNKSNGLLGPGLAWGMTKRNVFRGAETVNFKVYGSYEWQTGGGKYKGGDFDSYEFGIEGKLDFPRLLAPKFLYPSRRYTNWTRFAISADLLNRPGFFKMAQFNMAATWEWHGSRYSSHVLTPFKLTYNKLISRSAEFDSAMVSNIALAQSFENAFIPKIEYTYTFDRDITPVDHITLTAGVAEAGNVFSGIWSIFKASGRKELFGTPFSQFVKAQAQVVWTRKLGIAGELASRVFMGAAHAYGNSEEVPYREQFYVGGSNSVRAFAVRTLGPGSYHPAGSDRYAYYDQTGTFKFEANTEYRFPILGYFKGAIFLDAGNIWLLKDDPYRQGGKLKMKNFFDELALGTGIGLRFDMSMLVVRADLGIGIHVPYETDRHGYYNIPSFKDGLAFHLAIGYPF